MNIKKLIFFIVSTLIIGNLFSFLTMNNMNEYNSLVKPPLNPPGILFPIIWTILFILMGISLYLVSETRGKDKTNSYKLYIIQLLVNTFWTLFFFGLNLRLFSFLWIILLILLVVAMIYNFSKTNKLAAYLQIPYLLWILFAAYLNLSIYVLN